MLAKGACRELEQIVVVKHAPLELGSRVDLIDAPGELHERGRQRHGAGKRHLAASLLEGGLGLGPEVLHGLGAPLLAIWPLELAEQLAGGIGRALAGRQLGERLEARELAAAARKLVLMLELAGAQ